MLGISDGPARHEDRVVAANGPDDLRIFRLIKRDTDEVCGPRRGLHDDRVHGNVNRSHPLIKDGAQPRPGRIPHLVGQRVTEPTRPADLHRSHLLEIAGNRGLGRSIPLGGKAFREFILARYRICPDELGDGALAVLF